MHTYKRRITPTLVTDALRNLERLTTPKMDAFTPYAVSSGELLAT